MSKPQRLVPQYTGALSPQEVADGINAARKNAERLANDARILLDGERFASALALAILSIEETGKASILRSIGMSSSDKDLKKYWKEYRSHRSKNVLWATFDYIKRGARKLEDFAAMFNPASDHAQVLDELKQVAFYTECPRRGKWNQPDEIIDKDLAASIVTISAVFTRHSMVSPDELEIYFKHMSPVQRSNPQSIQQAFIAAYTEMQEKGIKPSGPNEAAALGSVNNYAIQM